MKLTNKHKVILLQNGMTQADIAKKVGTTQPVISNWLNGQIFPNAENLKKLADVLDLEPQELAEKLCDISNIG